MKIFLRPFQLLQHRHSMPLCGYLLFHPGTDWGFQAIIIKRRICPSLSRRFFIYRKYHYRLFFIQLSNFIFQTANSLIYFLRVHYLLSPRRLTAILFNFVIQIHQVRQKILQHTYRRPLRRGDLVQQLQESVSRSHRWYWWPDRDVPQHRCRFWLQYITCLCFIPGHWLRWCITSWRIIRLRLLSGLYFRRTESLIQNRFHIPIIRDSNVLRMVSFRVPHTSSVRSAAFTASTVTSLFISAMEFFHGETLLRDGLILWYDSLDCADFFSRHGINLFRNVCV